MGTLWSQDPNSDLPTHKVVAVTTLSSLPYYFFKIFNNSEEKQSVKKVQGTVSVYQGNFWHCPYFSCMEFNNYLIHSYTVQCPISRNQWSCSVFMGIRRHSLVSFKLIRQCEGRMRKVLEDVIKAESKKIVLVQHSVEGGRRTRGVGRCKISIWRKALLRNTNGESRCQATACMYPWVTKS